MLLIFGEFFIIVLILDNGKMYCLFFLVCFFVIFNEKYKKLYNFRILYFKINLFILEIVIFYKFFFFYYMVIEKSNILIM